MLNWASTTRLGLLAIPVATAAMLIFLLPAILGMTLLNLGGIHRTHGDLSGALARLTEAYRINPTNRRVVEGYAATQLALGKTVEALQIAMPIVLNCEQDSLQARFSLTVLLYNGRERDAAHLYQCLTNPPALPSGVAARLASALLHTDGFLPPETRAKLLGEAVGVYTPWQPEFEQLAHQFAQDDFWQSELGVALQNSLRWRSQTVLDNVAPLPTLGHDKTPMIIAAMLDMEPKKVTIGDNLAMNGGFEDYDWINDQPDGWTPTYMTADHTWSNGLFVTGVERGTHQSNLLRIDGLQSESSTEHFPAFAGFWHGPIEVAPHTAYLITLLYRTEGTIDSNARLWLSSDPDVLVGDDIYLPPTDGVWRAVSIIAWNRSNRPGVVRPLLRLFGEGTVWFDDFSLQEVTFHTDMVQPQLMLRIDDAKPK